MWGVNMKKYRREIIVGTITCAIWYVLQQAITSAPQTGKSVLATIQNYIYSCAAQTSSNSILLLVFVILLSLWLSFVISPVIVRIINYKQNRAIKKCEMSLKNLEENIENKGDNNVDNEAEIYRITKELAELKKKTENSERKRKVSGVILSIIVSAYLVYITISAIIPIVVLDMFIRDIQMIRPYTDSKTVSMIESDWTRMKSKEDYDDIYSVINSIKKENSLT